jgi:hypothetical protein
MTSCRVPPGAKDQGFNVLANRKPRLTSRSLVASANGRAAGDKAASAEC